jgi:endonuclease/exonuclease/phosphatase family metal-dependent hydrolase
LILAMLALAVPAAATQDDPPRRPRYGLAETLPRPEGTIRLATYNLLDLFDHDDDPELSGRFDDLPLAISETRANGLAAAIRAVDADLLALQEVESRDALIWFRDRYLADMGYDHVVAHDVGYFRGIECALLSRFEVVGERSWPGESLDDVTREGEGWASVPEGAHLTFRRSPLSVDVRGPDDYTLTLFIVHHKAGRDFNYQREAEALKIRELIAAVRETDPDRNVVVLGDFNAAPWDKSLRVYLQGGFVDTLAHRSVRGVEGRPYKTHLTGRVLDYILLNGHAYREYVTGSAHVYGTPASRDRRNGEPDPDGFASDHFPVVIDMVPEDCISRRDLDD